MIYILAINVDGKIFTMFLEQTPYGKKFVVYVDTEKGCVLYNFIAEQLIEFGCSDNEVITLHPKREAYFINFLFDNCVITYINNYIECKYERLPIYSINFHEAHLIGLDIVDEDTVFNWEINKRNMKKISKIN